MGFQYSALVTAAIAGDDEATAELLRSVWPDAYRIAWSLLRERAAAEDAAQDACARVLTAIATLRRPESFAVWFYRIVVNEAKRRRRTAAREVALDDGVPYDAFQGSEERIDVRRALDALEPAQRLTVVLYYYFTMKSGEIAQVTATSPVTVRWRLMAARRRLRVLLGGQPKPATVPPTVRGEFADDPHSSR
jgi:RNA polymerase sigma-70 factor (ECF subfamily)